VFEKNVLLGVRAWDIFMFVRVRIEYKAVAVRTMRRKNGNGKVMIREKGIGAITELLRKFSRCASSRGLHPKERESNVSRGARNRRARN
jgi:hypothetical protein